MRTQAGTDPHAGDTGGGRMIKHMVKSIVTRVLFVSACGLYLAGCAGGVELGPDAVKGKTADGTVDMQEVQAAYIGSGSAGTGVLVFRGTQYPFQVAGAGVGGIGLSTIDARGEVYNLRDLAQFPGTYGQARYGFAIGSSSAGDLWMQNESGVILHLKAKREGLILSLGGDAVVISMTK
jgi:hypothetical protein